MATSDEQHHKLWNIVKAELKKIVPPKAYPQSKIKLDGSFRAGVGTVLFFEDTAVIKDLQQKFALYADNFPIWSEHAAGIAQFAVWTALAQEGVGTSVQHYNPLIDDAVRKGVGSARQLAAARPDALWQHQAAGRRQGLHRR